MPIEFWILLIAVEIATVWLTCLFKTLSDQIFHLNEEIKELKKQIHSQH